MTSENHHASCVALSEFGLLIRGLSGAGKSDLVLRLLDEDRNYQLVSDDQTILVSEAQTLYASPPPNLAGKLEIRGQGIVIFPYLQKIKLSHIIDLVAPDLIARMPEAEDLQTTLMGQQFPRLRLDGFQSSAPARIRAFLRG
jgi:HPr kinase/phosphorylase